MSELLVQIAITGQYMENYGLEDGRDYWKAKGTHYELLVCNVPLSQVGRVIDELRVNDYGWSNEASSFSPYAYEVMPNKLADREFVEWEYKIYEEIRSISSSDLQAFLCVEAALTAYLERRDRGEPEEPKPLPYEEYDFM